MQVLQVGEGGVWHLQVTGATGVTDLGEVVVLDVQLLQTRLERAGKGALVDLLQLIRGLLQVLDAQVLLSTQSPGGAKSTWKAELGRRSMATSLSTRRSMGIDSAAEIDASISSRLSAREHVITRPALSW